MRKAAPTTGKRTVTKSRPKLLVVGEQPASSRHVFLSERGAPISTAGFARMLTRTADVAGLADLNVHPHMLRHAAGYKLANDGTDTRAIQLYLGHRQIQHTVRYTQLAA